MDFGSEEDLALSLIARPDGKLTVAGALITATVFDFALAQFNTDGTVDTSFGNGGLITTDFTGADDAAFALAVQSDGNPVLAGVAGADALDSTPTSPWRATSWRAVRTPRLWQSMTRQRRRQR